MSTDFPTAPLASCRIGAAGSGAVEKSLSASHTKILTLPANQTTEKLVDEVRNCQLCAKSLALLQSATCKPGRFRP